MSTYYGLHCKTDDSYTGTGTWNSDVLHDLINLMPELKIIRDKDTSGYIELSILGGFLGDYDTQLFDWLYQHNGHKIEVYNDYGEVS